MPVPGIIADSYNAPVGGGGWTPASLTGLELWFDASDTATITDAGAGAVSQWSDKSGLNRHFTMATAIQRPTTGTRTLNSLNVIDFQSAHAVTNGFAGINISQPNSIFVVAMTDTIAAGTGRIIGKSTIAGFNLGRSAGLAHYSAGTQRTAGSITAGVAFQMTGFYQDTLSRLRLNGVQVHDGTASSPGVNGIGVAGATVQIGFATVSTSMWDGTIAEIIVTSTNLNGTADMTNAELYLRTKWGFGWAPFDIAGCQLWLDASDTTTITDAGAGAVSGWTDKSGFGRNHIQNTALNRPTTGTRTMNGRNVIDFDGADPNWLSTTWSGTVNQPATVAVVIQSDSTPAGVGRVFGRSGSTTLNIGNNVSQWQYAAGTGQSAGTADTSAHMLVAFYDGTNSRLRLDGTQIHDGTAASPGTSSITGSAASIGSQTGGASAFDGAIAEIIVYSSNLNGTAELTTLENFLRTKWGTP